MSAVSRSSHHAITSTDWTDRHAGGKKLKCTGEQPACARCVKEYIACVYSPQKQMGRPKKRQRSDAAQESDQPAEAQWSNAMPSNEQNSFDEHAFNTSFNTSGLDTALTPSGNLQPWLPSGFDMTLGDAALPDETSIPALTPDSSSTSPPSFNLPHDLSHSHQPTQMVDPSLQVMMNPACACLSSMYLTLNTLQTMDAAFSFPFALHPLREAISTAGSVLNCEECPKRFITAIQNTHLVGTLIVSIAERFSKVLEAINRESARAAAANETKKFRLADLNTSTSHLHTGGLGCAAAFSIDLLPAEWRSMAKKVVKAEVHGPSGGNDCCVYFMSLPRQMTERQTRWHTQPKPSDFPLDKDGVPIGGHSIPAEEHMCLKFAKYAERHVDAYDWS